MISSFLMFPSMRKPNTLIENETSERLMQGMIVRIDARKLLEKIHRRLLGTCFYRLVHFKFNRSRFFLHRHFVLKLFYLYNVNIPYLLLKVNNNFWSAQIISVIL